MNVLEEFGEFINPYNSFDVKFLTQLMNKFKKHRKEANEAYLQIEHKASLPEKVELHPIQKLWISCQGIEQGFYRYKAGEEVYGMATFYDILKEIGLINHTQNTWDNAVQMGRERVATFAVNAKSKETAKYWKKREEDEKLMKIMSENLAKEELCSRFFNKLIQQGEEVHIAEELSIAVARHSQLPFPTLHSLLLPYLPPQESKTSTDPTNPHEPPNPT